ncbi:MAG: phage integrase family protein [Mesorhizobium sp.]|uniref:tyrosine-type recombinase/integrase n=1 Tax=Mesorhizobium sp. TaxID=1871066 RepID=UPI00121D7D3F|nr:tyrosine-type recombinase/integrase [Mesorhizobium sp.]TIQ41844.1 MAG: phage integrase family protein [Mesorhizobium sp.]
MPKLFERPEGGHALDLYEALVGSHPPRGRNYQLQHAWTFARLYPELDDWLSAPLDERIGTSEVRRGTAFATIKGRQYIYFLASIGRLDLDWDWIIGVSDHRFRDDYLPASVRAFQHRLGEQLVALGYKRGHQRIARAIRLFYLRYGNGVLSVGERHINEFKRSWKALEARSDEATIFRSRALFRSRQDAMSGVAWSLQLALYHQHLLSKPPRSTRIRPRALQVKPRMEALIVRYADARAAMGARPSTVEKYRNSGRHLANWLWDHEPDMESFSEVEREHILTYAAALVEDGLSLDVQLQRLCGLSVMFHDATAWDWPDAPLRPIIGSRDLPKRPTRLPRFIPAEQLDRLMSAVGALPDIHQRAALIVARWSGARRSEITRLEYDCLDAYPDGTPRLRIPAGKTGKERMVPLHPEAAAVIREVQALDPPGRGFTDERTGVEVRRLFSLKGKCISPQTLFEASLEAACRTAGLVDDRGRATITAHRFRHTVGTELIEGGARVHTVMKMLGHTSTGMTLVYAHLSDASVREDYLKVLGPGALIAGPLAETLRSRAMPEDSIAWLKANFFRTELELGHCLRLPEEGPCECDLYLTCAKFVTTPEYASRLRERRLREITLADEAQVKGFYRESERHDCTRSRIEQLLKDLGEPLLGPVD